MPSDRRDHAARDRVAKDALNEQFARIGKVFASPITWRRLVRIHRWRRPRQRVHPAKPTVGIRASQPNEIWQIDTTPVRLLDGSRVYYVDQHNSHLPRAAFHGQTPDEMYFGTGGDVPKQLQAARLGARQTRLAANRAVRCPSCSEPVAIIN